MSLPWWVLPLNIVVGAVIGFAIAEYRDWKRRRRERIGHFEALAAEVLVCSDLAWGYVRDDVQAPAYRMPVIAYQRSFPALLADGVLSFSETSAITRFYVSALWFNFAVDQAQAVLMKKKDDRPPERLGREAGRARKKAQKLIRSPDRPNHFTKAIEVIRRRLPKDARVRLSIAEEDLHEDEGEERELQT